MIYVKCDEKNYILPTLYCIFMKLVIGTWLTQYFRTGNASQSVNNIML